MGSCTSHLRQSSPSVKDEGFSLTDSDNNFGLQSSHDVIKFLGRGGTGDTWLFEDKQSKERVAIKLIRRPIPKVIMPNILREIRIQAELGEGHISIVNTKEAILTPTHLALVMEYAAGGSLTSYVADRWQKAQRTGLFLNEDEARYFFRQFLAAVEYCHLHCVAHRDLKLDNTLLDGSEPPLIKLCDFGFANTWTEEANMYTHIGTPVYMSPEIINARNGRNTGYDGRSVDVWASGVLLIVMLLGTFPFDHPEHPDPNTSEAHLEVWLAQIKQRWNDVPHIKNAVNKLSADCMNLLTRIFVIDEKKRITLEEIKEHPWYNRTLTPRLREAEKRFREQQAEVFGVFEKRRIDPAKLKARNQQLQHMLEEAGSAKHAAAQKGLWRIDLAEASIADKPLEGLPEEDLTRASQGDGLVASSSHSANESPAP